jgi:hypothetical protein
VATDEAVVAALLPGSMLWNRLGVRSAGLERVDRKSLVEASMGLGSDGQCIVQHIRIYRGLGEEASTNVVSSAYLLASHVRAVAAREECT